MVSKRSSPVASTSPASKVADRASTHAEDTTSSASQNARYGDRAHLVRRRETVEELYALESLLP